MPNFNSESEWLNVIMPRTRAMQGHLQGINLSGKRIACCQHITRSGIPLFMLLKNAGAEIYLASCNLNSTNDAVADYLAHQGIHVFAKSGMSMSEFRSNIGTLREIDADYLSDMGGELISAYSNKPSRVTAALEATTTGLHTLANKRLSFPVFNWNDINLKNNLHNRFHVGDVVWPRFNYITGMSLYGKTALVIGFGPVGRGVAERARVLGAHVYVCDKDPVRCLEAQHFGCQPVSLNYGLANSQIIVTATGLEKIIGEPELALCQNDAILFNVGHLSHEIDIDHLQTYANTQLMPNIEAFDIHSKRIFLLARGSLLNLAPNTGIHGIETFDLYEAFMMKAITWLMQQKPGVYPPGLQTFPAQIEQDIAHCLE